MSENDAAAGAPDDPDWLPDEAEDAPEGGAFELHVCSWCGALLSGDPEDELNGEGPGRDICGNCNRTKNFEAIEMDQ
jgi:hypothetical protein